MKLVGSGLRNRSHGRRVSSLRADAAGFNLELLHGVRERHQHGRAAHEAHVIRSVQRVVRAPARAAGNGEHRRSTAVVLRGQSVLNGTAGQSDQFRYVAAVERQFENSLGLDNRTDGRTPRLHHGRVRLNFNLLGDLADFEDHIDSRAAVDPQHDSGLYVCPESRQTRLQPIWTQRQVRENIGSGFIRYDVSSNTGLRLRYRDFDTGQHCAALVSDRAADLSHRLRPHKAAANTQNECSNANEIEYSLHASPF